MLIYRITKAEYAGQLTASGGPARWNSRNQFVIYTAASRSLACLENVVHRSGEGLASLFRVMVIDVPDGILIDTTEPETLPPDWTDYQQYGFCQQLGGNWLRQGQSVVLRVPSAIIANEWNYLLNPAHPDFQRVRLLQTEPFLFDPRIKQT